MTLFVMSSAERPSRGQDLFYSYRVEGMNPRYSRINLQVGVHRSLHSRFSFRILGEIAGITEAVVLLRGKVGSR